MMETIVTEKKCSGCKTIKSLSEFYNNKSAKDGKNTYCKICWNEKVKQRDIEHPEQAKRWKKYEQNNKELLAKKAQIRRDTFPELVRKIWTKANKKRDPEKRRAWQHQY